MQKAVFFPYFYIPNENFIRHQLLYAETMARMQASDRLPQDSKSVKKLAKQLAEDGFYDPIIPEEANDRVSNKVKTCLERAFEKEDEIYVKIFGKYGKERTSSKTFNMCRVKIWEPLVKYLVRMDLATLDGIAAGSHVDFEKMREIQEKLDEEELKAEWCFSTRKVIQAFVISLTLEYQKENNMPRATDDILHDQMAALLEGMPQSDGTDHMVNRAVLEFTYPIPAGLDEMEIDAIKELRESFLEHALNYTRCVEDGAKSLEVAPTQKDADPIMQNIQKDCREMQQELKSIIQNAGYKTKTAYGQIRWYPAKDSGLDSATMPAPYHTGHLGLKLVSVPVCKAFKDSIHYYPACWLWSLESPTMEQSSGFTRLLRKWFG